MRIQIIYHTTWNVTNPPGGVVVNVLNSTGIIPTVYNLYQNYPNPFNPNTTIKFDIPRQSYTKLIIYDILGREVTKLIDEKLDAGSYDITWDAASYASGTYIYKIEAGDYTSVKKMILVK